MEDYDRLRLDQTGLSREARSVFIWLVACGFNHKCNIGSLELTNQEIAEKLSCSAANVARYIKLFRSKNLIGTSGRARSRRISFNYFLVKTDNGYFLKSFNRDQLLLPENVKIDTSNNERIVKEHSLNNETISNEFPDKEQIHTQIHNLEPLHIKNKSINHNPLAITHNLQSINHNPLKEKIKNKKESSKYEYTEEFEEIWNLYGKAGSKKEGFSAFKQALQRVDIGTLREKIPRYLRSKKVREGFKKHLSSWLNGDCWDSYYELEFVENGAELEEKVQHNGLSREFIEGEKRLALVRKRRDEKKRLGLHLSEPLPLDHPLVNDQDRKDHARIAQKRQVILTA